jgi:hypothetical protein
MLRLPATQDLESLLRKIEALSLTVPVPTGRPNKRIKSQDKSTKDPGLHLTVAITIQLLRISERATQQVPSFNEIVPRLWL